MLEPRAIQGRVATHGTSGMTVATRTAMPIRPLVWAALLAGAGCSLTGPIEAGLPNQGDDCVDHRSLVITADKLARTPQTQFMVERCRMDADSCQPLCNYALKSVGVTDPLSECAVAFDSNVYVAVAYDHFREDVGCAVPEPFAAGSGTSQGGTK